MNELQTNNTHLFQKREKNYSYVVTGGGRGIGKAIVERLLFRSSSVVVIERDSEAIAWIHAHPAGKRVMAVVGDATDENTTERAADLAQDAGILAGWVNNAAVFQDASIHAASAETILECIRKNLAPVLLGCWTSIRRFLDMGKGGAIVNISSHQARQAVPGCTPYVTAKAAIEGLTRALAVEYGPFGIRVNAVAPGSVLTERYEEYLSRQTPENAAMIKQEMGRLHPLGRVARSEEIATVVCHLLSDEASFVSGATIPVDGGRSVLARDPEATPAVITSSAQPEEEQIHAQS